MKLKSSIKKLKNQLESNRSGKAEKFIISAFFSKTSSFYLYELRFRSYIKYFKSRNLKGIVLSDENSPQQKVIQYAAKSHGIKIYGLQHGAIYYLHMAYTFSKYKTKPLLPDVTFLWGKHYEDVLLGIGGYKKSQLEVVGRVEPLSQQKVDKLKIKSEKKIILLASQPQPDENLRKQYLKDIFFAMIKLVDKYELVIRPHPAEKDNSYFEEIGHSINFKNFIIDRKSDLKTHFEKCDILITAYSTVGAEFIPYYKPLLVLDYLEQDLVSYIKVGVGIPIKNRIELQEVLSKDLIEYNKPAYNEFIKNFFYKMDGNAAERIIKTINKQA